jgi:glucose-6-phosphate 1-epimerase
MDDDTGVSVRLRTHEVILDQCICANTGAVVLQPNPRITKLYTRDFQLAYVVTLAEHELNTDVHVSNPSPSETLEFQALLHTYIRAPANEVSISPLLGKRYIDKTEKSLEARNTLKEEKRSGVDVRTFTDSVYEDAPPKVNVSWPGGGLELKLVGFTTLTVWNPQAEAGSKMGDMEEGGWCVIPLFLNEEMFTTTRRERFVCVEPGYVRGFKQLGPGEKWVGQQVLTLS